MIDERQRTRKVRLMDAWGYAIVGGAAVVGGLMNAVSGGGTLVTFPALLAVGVPPVAANVTNTVALTPGYLSGAVAQRADLVGQRQRLMRLVPPTVAGGVIGAALLLVTDDDTLRLLIPVLIAVGTLMLAASNPIKRWLGRSKQGDASHGGNVPDARWLSGAIALAGVYGGYFGAGVGVMLLAVLGIGVHQPLNKSNAVKQVLSFATNLTAALYFVVAAALGHGRVWWGVAVVMAIGSIVGGTLGGRLASRLDPDRFRTIVVTLGVVLTIVYAVRVYA